MKFQPKTDWKYDDTPTEADFNRIEQGIVDAHEKLELNGEGLGDVKTKVDEVGQLFESHMVDNNHVKVGESVPQSQVVGGIWFQTGLGGIDWSGGGGLSIQNAVISEEPPENKSSLWLNI